MSATKTKTTGSKQEILLARLSSNSFTRKYLPRIDPETKCPEVVLVANEGVDFTVVFQDFTTSYLNHSGIRLNKDDQVLWLDPHNPWIADLLALNFPLPDFSQYNEVALAHYCIAEGINTTASLAEFIGENDAEFGYSYVSLSNLAHWLASLLKGKTLSLGVNDLFIAFYSAFPLSGFARRMKELANLKIFRWHESEDDIYNYLHATAKGNFVGAVRCGYSLHELNAVDVNQFTYLYVDGATNEEGKLRLYWMRLDLNYGLMGDYDEVPVTFKSINTLHKEARLYTANRSDKLDRIIVESSNDEVGAPRGGDQMDESEDYANDDMFPDQNYGGGDNPPFVAVGNPYGVIQANPNRRAYKGTAATTIKRIIAKK